jgi:hypothetical protein
MDWSEVEPVLNATYDLLDEQESTTPEAVSNALGKPTGDERTIRALAYLYDADFITGQTIEQSAAPVFIQATEKGLQAVRGWPGGGSDAQLVELLLRVLDERIESDETPEEEKGRLRRARDAFAAVGRDVAVGVLTAYAGQLSGAAGGSGSGAPS